MRLAPLLLLVACARPLPSAEAGVEALVRRDLLGFATLAGEAVPAIDGLEGAVEVLAEDEVGCAWALQLEATGGAGTLSAAPRAVPCGAVVEHGALDVAVQAAGLQGTTTQTGERSVRIEATGDRLATVEARTEAGVVALDGDLDVRVLRAVGEHDVLVQLELQADYVDLAGSPGTLDALGTAAGGWDGALGVGRGTSCLIAGSLEAPTVACGGVIGE